MRSKATALTTRRRTLRMAAVALTAAAGLGLTACSGSDDSGAKTMGHAAAAESSNGSTGDKAQSTSSGGGKTDATTDAQTGTKPGTKSATGNGNGHGDSSGTPVSNLPLPDGSEARVTKTGDQNYRAEIVDKGAVLATIETHDGAAGLDANDMFVVLTTDGRIHAWMGDSQTGPGTFALKGGYDAKITKVGELHYRAELTDGDGNTIDTIETADQHDIGMDANGVYIVLSTGGVISSHD